MNLSGWINWAEWKPPYDPFKPKLPYQSGLQIQTRRHIPPPPFGQGYKRPQRHMPVRREHLHDRLPSEFCFQNPPPSTAPHPDSSTHTLNIVKEIATGDGRGPQVVCCQLDGEERYLVAKIFDPLYYAWDLSDVAYLSDRQYSCEAAGYEQIQRAGIDGKYLPRYHGSWTFDAPLAGQPDKIREVRMVLVDYISDATMYSLLTTNQVDKFSPDTRLNLLAEAMEKYCWLQFFGVVQRDFAPRNIIVNKEPSIILIDLSQAYVIGLHLSESRFRSERRPRNPIDAFQGRCSEEFNCWVPEGYQSKSVIRRWMNARWGTSEEFEPYPDYLDDPRYMED